MSSETLDEVIQKIHDLSFAIPMYYQQHITQEIFKSVLNDRLMIIAMIERLKNEQ